MRLSPQPYMLFASNFLSKLPQVVRDNAMLVAFHLEKVFFISRKKLSLLNGSNEGILTLHHELRGPFFLQKSSHYITSCGLPRPILKSSSQSRVWCPNLKFRRQNRTKKFKQKTQLIDRASNPDSLGRIFSPRPRATPSVVV